MSHRYLTFEDAALYTVGDYMCAPFRIYRLLCVQGTTFLHLHLFQA